MINQLFFNFDMEKITKNILELFLVVNGFQPVRKLSQWSFLLA
ncbi:hypothetical protein J2Z62_000446 [Mycoplasmoides fastidiosum]|uniref:Transposase n=1 Tax=Mycoplasmoides fastidiosum TaxID=92758 RepID=A0ABU0LZA0_9BACT|nr:hypothetical protein [Mycoplasmoides fastidiosum]